MAEDHVSYYTTDRGPDILPTRCDCFGICAFCQINKFFVNILVFHYWQNAFVGPIWPSDCRLETANVEFCVCS